MNERARYEIDESWFVSPEGLPLLTAEQLAAARVAGAAKSPHLERYHLNKDHADRGKQFKPFAALRGYEQLVEREIQRANRERDFTKPEESC